MVYHQHNLNPLAPAKTGVGANMALRREALDLVGPFDPALDAGTPTRSGGDTEYFSRILSRGYQIIYDPAALNWHRHRTSWQELRQTIYGYGVGTYAFWTRALLVEGEVGVLGIALWWLSLYQLPGLIKALLRRPGSMPVDLVLAELRGCFAGPGAYLKARKTKNPLNQPI
jgi:GT2 family glycosyltransferase